RIHDFLNRERRGEHIHTLYIPSSDNPADAPSRGLYPPRSRLLRPVLLPEGLGRFVVDASSNLSPRERQAIHTGSYPIAAAKTHQAALNRDVRQRFNDKRFWEERAKVDSIGPG
ncbi:hypothetical protein C0991_010982, partial [Blastosporella zonata]